MLRRLKKSSMDSFECSENPESLLFDSFEYSNNIEGLLFG